MYFDDLPIGYQFTTAQRRLPMQEIVDFARQWDPQPFHTDEVAAKASIYKGIIASGFHTMLTAFALTLEADIFNESSMGSPGMQDIRWTKPVRPQDRLEVRGEVVGSVPSRSRPDRGRTEIDYEVVNQDGDVVMSYRVTHLLRRAAQTA